MSTLGVVIWRQRKFRSMVIVVMPNPLIAINDWLSKKWTMATVKTEIIPEDHVPKRFLYEEIENRNVPKSDRKTLQGYPEGFAEGL